MGLLTTLALLLVAHALADYPLQGDFMARAKNPTAPLPGVPWPWIMSAHAAIHAGFVGLITGSLLLGVLEFIAHWWIDYEKCRGRLTFGQDQSLHLWCKLMWVTMILVGAA